jgi:uncharacterized membrane protein
MTRHHFSLQEAFTFGWAKTKQHYWFVVLTFLIGAIITVSTSRIHLLNSIVILLVGLSIASISLQMSRDTPFSFIDLFNPLLSPEKVLKYLILAIVYLIPAIISAVALFRTPAHWGSLFVIIPSLYIAVRFKFFPYVVIDNEHATVKELIKMSFKLTNNHFWKIFLFLCVAAVINLIGAFTIVGLLVTIPVTVLATSQVYNKLKEHSF